MTRINAGIPPYTLSTKHLLAEHREIKRIPNTIRSGKANLTNIPTEFNLGPGHVKFFYNKQLFLYTRYKELLTECKKRNFKVTDYSSAWDTLNQTDLWNSWTPEQIDIDKIKERILLRSPNLVL